MGALHVCIVRTLLVLHELLCVQVTPEGERSHLVVVDYVLSNSAAGILIVSDSI